MRIALATRSNLPSWEVDDKILRAALVDRGIEVSEVPWDRPDVAWEDFDACVIRTTWDYQERRADFVGWAERAAGVTRLFNPAPIVRWNTHKSYLRDLEARGVPVVPTVWLQAGSRVDVARLLEERGWRRGFLKPAVGAAARATMRFDAAQAGRAQRHLERLLECEDMMLQPYLASVESEGEISAVFIDAELTHAVRKIPVPGDYRVQDDFGARDEPRTLSPGELALARHAVQAAPGPVLYARADFIRDDAGDLRVTELELVEPSLFFRHGRHAAARLADALIQRLRPAGG